jgi:hypothetical protein
VQGGADPEFSVCRYYCTNPARIRILLLAQLRLETQNHLPFLILNWPGIE